MGRKRNHFGNRHHATDDHTVVMRIHEADRVGLHNRLNKEVAAQLVGCHHAYFPGAVVKSCFHITSPQPSPPGGEKILFNSFSFYPFSKNNRILILPHPHPSPPGEGKTLVVCFLLYINPSLLSLQLYYRPISRHPP